MDQINHSQKIKVCLAIHLSYFEIEHSWKRVQQALDLYHDLNIMRNKFYFDTLNEHSAEVAQISAELKLKVEEIKNLQRDNKYESFFI